MTEDEFDQNAWLKRIDYEGSLEPTLETLDGLVTAHSQSIAYETLDIMLGCPPKLDLHSLQSKMIAGRRGGYCFEQNILFRAGLRSLGYRITTLQGRFVRGLEIDAARPAIHMVLQIDLPEGAFLADVGFGNLGPTSALRLEPEIKQTTPHETMRFVDVGGELTLQAHVGGRWEHVYRVIPHPRFDSEIEIVNWYTGTHPDTPYQGNIIASKPSPEGRRITMYNSRFTLRDAAGKAERHYLESEADFRDILRGQFRLNISDDQIGRCVEIMRVKGTGDAPHPFFT